MMRLIKIGLLLSVGCFSAALSASELTIEWDWMLSSEMVKQRETAFLSVTEDADQQSFSGLLDVQLGYQDWTAILAVKGDDLYYRSSIKDQHQSRAVDFIISELFWQSSVDIVDISLDLQLGKVRIDWGVGYGYRPLDIFTPYRRNPIGIQVEEGAGVASVSYFDDQGEWTLIYTDSSWAQQDGNALEEQNEQQGVGIRRYGLVGDTEYQWLAYYDDVRRGLLGASLVTVIDTAWEFHSSAVYQAEYYAYQESKTVPYFISLDKQDNAYQALAGFTWADAIGNSVVLEYWYDSRGWSERQWKKAIEIKALMYQQGFNHTNMVRNNIMFHWSLDPNAFASWQWSKNADWLTKLTPTFDVLYSPQDNGVMVTQWLNYLLHDSGQSSVEAELAARFIGGKSESVYANLPDNYMLLFNLKGRF